MVKLWATWGSVSQAVNANTLQNILPQQFHQQKGLHDHKTMRRKTSAQVDASYPTLASPPVAACVETGLRGCDHSSILSP